MKSLFRPRVRTAVNLLALAGIAVSLTTLAACQVTRKPDGTWEVTEAPDRTKDGVYGRQDIGGKCYLSNGTWCIPCNGGKIQKCADIIDVVTPIKPTTPGQSTPRGGNGSATDFGPNSKLSAIKYIGPCAGDQPSDILVTSFKEMTGGVAWDQISAVYGMDGWRFGESHSSDFSLNFYDSDTGTVDITYLTEFNTLTPNPGCYTDASGNPLLVEILYAGGDPNDNIPDPIGVRIRGHRDTVADLAKATTGSFTGSVPTEYGTFGVSNDGETIEVTWESTVVYQR